MTFILYGGSLKTPLFLDGTDAYTVDLYHHETNRVTLETLDRKQTTEWSADGWIILCVEEAVALYQLCGDIVLEIRTEAGKVVFTASEESRERHRQWQESYARARAAG